MKAVLRLLLFTTVVAVLAAGMELAFRALDARQSRTAKAVPPGDLAKSYVDALPVADGAQRGWFALSPAPLPKPPLPPELVPLTALNTSEVFKQWNTRLIQERVCGGDPLFEKFPGFAFSFEPEDGSSHPPYRYLPGIATQFGLVTNRFGFRGHEIDADKPMRTVRIAFVGASTTVGSHSQPFSYPELMEPWLNAWAMQAAPGVRFETINAGREGIVSPDIASIVRHEVVPLEPDVVVYLEGSNQFLPRELVQSTSGPIVVPQKVESSFDVPWTRRSALMRHVEITARRFGLGAGTEPRKPGHRVRWPASASPDDSKLPLQLPQIMHDLDDIRSALKPVDATLVLSSFIWMVKDGLVVNRAIHEYYYQNVNVRFWPLTYAELRQLADYQNQVFRAYAKSRGIPFIDPASVYPLDLALFGDPVHMSADGDRLRAWVMFQELVPILGEQIRSGRLPAADRSPFRAVPSGTAWPRATLECTSYGQYREIAGALPLDKLGPAGDGATVTGSAVKHVVSSGTRYAYAAEAPLARLSGSGVVRIRIHVISGSVSIGILKKDRSTFIVSRNADAGHGPADVYLPVPALEDAGALVISNALGQPGERSTVDVEGTAVLISEGRGSSVARE